MPLAGILPCSILIPGLFFIPESPRWLVSFPYLCSLSVIRCIIIDLNFVSQVQAKMGMTEEFETSLQVLRGFDTDISVEVSEIKVTRIHHSSY